MFTAAMEIIKLFRSDSEGEWQCQIALYVVYSTAYRISDMNLIDFEQFWTYFDMENNEFLCKNSIMFLNLVWLRADLRNFHNKYFIAELITYFYLNK